MKGLKSAVAIMSILIVLALCLLGYGIYKRFGGGTTPQELAEEGQRVVAQREAAEQNAPPTLMINGAEVEVAPAPQGLKNITLPPRSTIRQMMPYKNGVALHVRTTKGEYIFYINTVTAKMEGALKINYAAINNLSTKPAQPPQQPRK
jgi:hypothetical protein